MPSSLAWTVGWAAYFGWIMKETWETRRLESGFHPIFLAKSYRTKEQYLKSKEVIAKYEEELDAVDKENITAEDIQKFQLTRSSYGLPFWHIIKTNPHWVKVDHEARKKAREQMFEEHPDYVKLAPINDEGGPKALFNLPGPWMKSGYDDGLHGDFQALVKRVAHHAHTEAHGDAHAAHH
jgi:hypothetical protein